MRRVVMVSGVLSLFLASLVLLPSAEARVGGGGSSGSRGSRSYSAPRSPSTPLSPSSPASPTSPSRMAPTPAPVPQQPGGFLSRWGGMLGGLALGGLLGSLLFGHGGGMGLGGGIGLLEILVLAGLAFLAFQLFRRRAPATPSGYGRSSWAPAEPTERTSGVADVPSVAVAPQDDDLGRGLAAIRMMDPGFDPTRFIAIATDLFQRLQIGWSNRDLASVRAQLTDEMAAALEKDLTRLREQRRVNHVDKVTVDSAEVTEAWQEYGRDLVTLRLKASALDYTVDEASGAVVEGSNTVPTSFEEYWTFVRPVGPNGWRVSAIQQPPA